MRPSSSNHLANCLWHRVHSSTLVAASSIHLNSVPCPLWQLRQSTRRFLFLGSTAFSPSGCAECVRVVVARRAERVDGRLVEQVHAVRAVRRMTGGARAVDHRLRASPGRPRAAPSCPRGRTRQSAGTAAFSSFSCLDAWGLWQFTHPFLSATGQCRRAFDRVVVHHLAVAVLAELVAGLLGGERRRGVGRLVAPVARGGSRAAGARC